MVSSLGTDIGDLNLIENSTFKVGEKPLRRFEAMRQGDLFGNKKYSSFLIFSRPPQLYID
jgi:hypothetical protein